MPDVGLDYTQQLVMKYYLVSENNDDRNNKHAEFGFYFTKHNDKMMFHDIDDNYYVNDHTNRKVNQEISAYY